MKLSEEIFAYGMSQRPVASSASGPREPYKSWAIKVAHLEAEIESVRASDKEAWAWVDETCKLLNCGVAGVFNIKSKISQLKDKVRAYEEISKAEAILSGTVPPDTQGECVMTDWLSEIEERFNRFRQSKEEYNEPLFRYKDVKRMARVIRELVDLL